MSQTVFFVKPCPSCGRKAQIGISLLGRYVRCNHCRREFVATDPESESAALEDPVSYWINFTDHKFQEEALRDSDLARRPR